MTWISEHVTPDEARWLRRLARVFAACPSTRLAAATMGDSCLTFYDRDEERRNPVDEKDDGDFIPTLERRGAILASVDTVLTIASTAA